MQACGFLGEGRGFLCFTRRPSPVTETKFALPDLHTASRFVLQKLSLHSRSHGTRPRLASATQNETAKSNCSPRHSGESFAPKFPALPWGADAKSELAEIQLASNHCPCTPTESCAGARGLASLIKMQVACVCVKGSGYLRCS